MVGLLLLWPTSRAHSIAVAELAVAARAARTYVLTFCWLVVQLYAAGCSFILQLLPRFSGLPGQYDLSATLTHNATLASLILSRPWIFLDLQSCDDCG